MGPKRYDNNGCLPSFGNNFVTLFGLMVLDDEDSRRRVEDTEDEALENKGLDMNEDFDDSSDTDFDDDFSEDDDEEYD